MKVDWSKLNEVATEMKEDKNINSSSGSNYDHLVEDWTIKDDPLDFRILPPTEDMNGIPFIRLIRYKIGKTRFVSMKGLAGNDECILEKLYLHYEAKAKQSDDIKALFKNFKTFQREVVYAVPCIIFKEGEDTPMISTSSILFLKTNNFDRLYKIMAAPKYRKKDTALGVMSREHGRCFTISSRGKSIMPDPDVSDFTEEFYDDFYDGAKRKSVFEYIYATQKSEKHIASVFANYFESKEIVEDDGSTRKELLARIKTVENTEEETKKAPKKGRGKAKKAEVDFTVDKKEEGSAADILKELGIG